MKIIATDNQNTKPLYCNNAWGHLDFKPGGYAPCYRFKNDPSFGTIDDLPSEAINNESWIELRKNLRDGVWPKGCIDCKIQEENGIMSYRQRSLENGLEPDFSINVVYIKDLQLKMSKVCNLSCRHCSTSYNSGFARVGRQNPFVAKSLESIHDFRHIAAQERKEIRNPTEDTINDLFENVFPTVKFLTFSGGEPFYHPGMYETLERLIADPKIDTTKMKLLYNTNATIFDERLPELWSHFRVVDIVVSLDGTGDMFEYFRVGAKYEEVVENLRKMHSIVNRILFVCTTSAYHAFYMDQISKDMLKLVSEFENSDARLTFVHWPKGLDIVNLAEGTKKELSSQVEENWLTKEFLMRLNSGERTLPEETFKELVKLQDQLYGDASSLAPRIFDYVYG